MEILNKQAPVGLHSGVNNARTGLSSSSLSSTLTRPSSAAVERHGLLVGVGPTLLVPMKILLVSNGRIAFVSPVERRKPTTVYYYPQGITRPRSRGRAYSRAETRDECSRRCNVTSVNVGGFREGLKGVGRVAHLRESGECGRSRWPVSSSLNGNHGAKESYLDLELEVFRFMQQSSKPDAFPTRQDLILAGRTDLVMAIEEEGGWLAAGWEDGSNFDAIEDNTDGRRGVTGGSRRQGSKSKFKTRSLKESISKARKSSSKVSTVRIEEPAHGITEPLVGINVVREVANAVDDKDGRMKSNRGTRLNIEGEPQEVLPILERAQVPYKEKSTPRRRKSSRGPNHDEFQVMERIASLISFTEELKLNRSQIGYQRDDLSQDSARNDFSKGTIVGTMSRRIFPENGFPNVTMGEFPVENSLRDSRDTTVDVAALPKRKRKHRKEERAKIVKENSTDKVNGTSDWIHKTVDKREELMRETRSRSDENSSGASVGDDSDSMQNRIHILAARLADTRATLQLGREALWRTENEEEGQKRAMEELIDAEDTLEFRENAIMHARTELNTTRAQITALEGNMKVEIMEAQKVLDERNQQIERARAVYRKLRTTRIVWPNHGNKVFLTGSFDGWNRQIEMEKSSAGVFVVSLTLYPGRYEIKFVVDGSWRVDTNRPIVYVGGFENNVLMVS